MSVVDRSYDHPLALEERATMPLAGGLMQQGYQCGMLWGAALAAGAQAYRLYGPGALAETQAIRASHRLMESFRLRNKAIDCFEITGLDWKPKVKNQVKNQDKNQIENQVENQDKNRRMAQVFKFFVKGGPIRCFTMAARYAPLALSEINATYSSEALDLPASPLSCATLLAQKMGASEAQAVMAAGFAGGIGLSGGGCGALGAAIWISAMNAIKNGATSNLYESKAFQSQAEDTIERFLQSAGYEFECSKIVGRKFENVGDHAAHLRAGGCSEIISTLAAA
jgi:hypothetical protein